MKLISWNVNGIRAAGKKGFADWFASSGADCVSLQEVKAFQEQVPSEVITYPGYEVFWHAAKKPGYSGTACLTKIKPNKVVQGFARGKETDAFDNEGRALQLHFDDFVLVNCYFPNAQPDHGRLPYKLAFNTEIQNFCDRVRAEGQEVIVCGDFNVAHQEIDLARPKENENSSGFLPEERAWMSEFLKSGMVDAYRSLYPNSVKGQEYSWWTYRANARANNVGWRIDYHAMSPGIAKRLSSAWHECKTFGSDHCPVGIEIKDK